MKIALTIFRYFPYGGLQKDCIRCAKEFLDRGHKVVLFTMETTDTEIKIEKGAKPETGTGHYSPSEFEIRVVKVSGFSNHSRAKNFEQNVLAIIARENFDCIVGFNRMAGLDFYFAGDNCLAESLPKRYPPWFLRLNPRHRTWLQMEKSVFDERQSSAIAFVISAHQREEYRRRYGTPADRFVLVPPDIDSRCGNVAEPNAVRERARKKLGLRAGESAVLFVGSDFSRKGAVRAITALASLPENLLGNAKFFAVGDDDAGKLLSAAAELGIGDKIFALGGRDDVPELLLAADCMVHPAADEAGGSVLIEALVSGLPVICTDVCGFADYVRKAFCPEMILGSPYSQRELNGKLETLLRNLPGYAAKIDPEKVKRDLALYRRFKVVADYIERKNGGGAFAPSAAPVPVKF